MAKLTISMDEGVLRAATRYAAAHGTSVSRLMERYLGLFSSPPRAERQTSVLRMLRGAGRRRVTAERRARFQVRKSR